MGTVAGTLVSEQHAALLTPWEQSQPVRAATRRLEASEPTGAPLHPEHDMFKVIGAVVVYGFALLGLAKYLESTHLDA
jgi:hypothetical protein